MEIGKIVLPKQFIMRNSLFIPWQSFSQLFKSRNHVNVEINELENFIDKLIE